MNCPCGRWEMGKSPVYKANLFFVAIFGWCLGSPPPGSAAVAPVGQLPTVAVSVTPSVYALPILLVENAGEWKDFGIQAKVKVHLHGEEQLDRSAANEWEVAVMDPLTAVKGGNEGNVAIVGIAGNFAGQIPFIQNQSATPSAQRKWNEWLKGFSTGEGWKGKKVFLPACLVATANYADTRKTLVIRWLEGYARGIRIIQKDPAMAAARLKEFYRETLRKDLPEPLLRQEVHAAFYFEDRDREEPFRAKEGKPSPLEEFARSMTAYLKGMKALEGQAEPSEYLLPRICDQLSALRKEAVTQLEKTAGAIEAAGQAGARVNHFQKTWEESKAQVEDGRGCLTVIGVLSDLQRSADQARVNNARLRDFRRIETAVGGILALYYAGYYYHRRKRAKAHSS